MAEHPEPDLGAVLRRAADRHVPDRDAMLTRIVQARSRPARSRWALSLRPVAAAASVVATLVAGFTGIRLLDDHAEPERAPAATDASPSPSSPPSPSAGAAPSASASARTPRNDKGREPEPSAAITTGGSPTGQPVNGFLSSAAVVDAHSVGTWAQGNVTLTTTATITALEVVINVEKTAGVRDSGRWTTVPAEMITATVTEEKERLVYRFSLKDGTLAAGSYVFAVQYQRATADRDASADTYGALATAGGRQVPVTGTFPRK